MRHYNISHWKRFTLPRIVATTTVRGCVSHPSDMTIDRSLLTDCYPCTRHVDFLLHMPRLASFTVSLTLTNFQTTYLVDLMSLSTHHPTLSLLNIRELESFPRK